MSFLEHKDLNSLEGEFESGMTYDISYSYGKNELDYFLNNTVNGDLALVGTCPNCEIAQRDFDVGGYAQEETNFNIDFSYLITDSVNLAFGFEIREETFTAFAGEPNSFFGGGSSGFRGVEPVNAGDFKRDNVAVYADVEHDISDELLVQYAARYENFSDFGSTLNGKLAARYRVSESLAFRGAVSTGFHAPTPGQSNASNIPWLSSCSVIALHRGALNRSRMAVCSRKLRIDVGWVCSTSSTR